MVAWCISYSPTLLNGLFLLKHIGLIDLNFLIDQWAIDLVHQYVCDYEIQQVYTYDQDTRSSVSGQERHAAHKLRHTVMCQRPRKTCGTQVCYLQEPLSDCFQHLILLDQFLSNLLILCPPNTRLGISNLRKISQVILEICVSKNCPIFHIFLLYTDFKQ